MSILSNVLNHISSVHRDIKSTIEILELNQIESVKELQSHSDSLLTNVTAAKIDYDKTPIGKLLNKIVGHDEFDASKVKGRLEEVVVDIMNKQNTSEEDVRSEYETIQPSLENTSLRPGSGTTLDSFYIHDGYILGHGSFGITHRLKHKRNNCFYAVKTIQIQAMQMKGLTLKHLMKESLFLQTLNHPNIVQYVDSFIDDSLGVFCLVMELIEGGSLDLKMKALIPPTITQLKGWLLQTLNALNYMHEELGIIHRDIKPQNILLTTPPDSHIKIIDLGLATMAVTALHTIAVGTPYYASYEKIHGIPYDGRDDIWGVGCIWSELLTRIPISERGLHIIGEYTEQQRLLHIQVLIDDCIEKDKEIGSILSKMLDPIQDCRYTAKQCLDLLTGIMNKVNNSNDITLTTSSNGGPVKSVSVQNTSYLFMSGLSHTVIDVEGHHRSIATGVEFKEWIQCALDNDRYHFEIMWKKYDYTQYFSSCVVYDRNDSSLMILLLHYSCQINHLDIVRFLLFHGIDVNSMNENGDTALLWVSGLGYIHIVRELITYHANINQQNHVGNTALICASYMGHIDIIQYLLDHGADIHIHNNDGDSALMIAREENHDDVIKLLEEQYHATYQQI